MQRVRILLSTYNGVRFLAPLLDSLLAQDYPSIEILVRDDGSHDETPTFLERFATHPSVRVRNDTNVGVVRSFVALLREPAEQVGYFAFCDQDDVWDRDKVSRAVSVLESAPEGPKLYCGRARVVTEDLQSIGLTPVPGRPLTFQNALVQNVAIGCTVMMNSSGRDLVVDKAVPASAVMHDWWAYLVLSALGQVLFDDEPKVMYRQHAQSVVGAQLSLFSFWKSRIERFRRNRHVLGLREQASSFRTLFGSHLNTTNKKSLDEFLTVRATAKERLLYAVRTDLYRQSPIDDVILRALIALGRV